MPKRVDDVKKKMIRGLFDQRTIVIEPMIETEMEGHFVEGYCCEQRKRQIRLANKKQKKRRYGFNISDVQNEDPFRENAWLACARGKW